MVFRSYGARDHKSDDTHELAVASIPSTERAERDGGEGGRGPREIPHQNRRAERALLSKKSLTIFGRWTNRGDVTM